MFVLIPLAMLSAAMASGQAARSTAVVAPPGGQVAPATGRGEVATQQIANTRASEPIDQVPRASGQRPNAAQITAKAAGSVPQPQLAEQGRKSASLSQLGPGTRSAAAPASAATRAEGRRTELVRVGGSDRCDPQLQSADVARCQRVIETRAAEFNSPAPPTLTPEQRLLRDQDRGGIRSVAAAAQRIGRADVDADATDTQVLAAISQGQGQGEVPAIKVPAEPDQLPTSAALIQMIEAAQNGAPRR